MTNKTGNATNKKIIELLQDYRSGLLILKPKFQRNLVWNDSHKAKFIETIFDQMPFPEIYLADGEIDLENQKTTIWVVDGQQRLSTIFNYIEGKIDLQKYNIGTYDSLSKDQKTAFLSYIVVIRQLGGMSEDQIKDIFKRINSVNYALNAVEISNALYEGEFISTAKAIVQSKKFKDLSILNDSDTSRMKDLEYILLVISSVELGYYYTQVSELENVIQRFNNEYTNSSKMEEAAFRSIDLIASLEIAYDSIWLTKSAMFTLLTELTKLNFYRGNLVLDVEVFKSKIIDAEKQIISAKTGDSSNNKYAKFYKHIFQQTTSKTGRDARALVLTEIIDSSISLL